MTKLDTKLRTIGGGWVGEQPNIAHVDFATKQSYTLQLFISEERNQRAPASRKL